MKNNSTGSVLRYTRERYCWSQSMLAEKIGVDTKTVSRWERGEAFPNQYALHQLCEEFDTTPQALFPRIPEHAWAALLSTTEEAQPGDHLKRERLQRVLSQAGLAAAIGASTLSVIRWEKGQSVPNLYYREKLCRLFEKTTAELFPEHVTPNALLSSCSAPAKGMANRSHTSRSTQIDRNATSKQVSTSCVKNHWLQYYRSLW